jgi:hypothetical protein
MALPHRTADRDFLAHDVEHALAIDPDARILLEHRGQRSPALEPHLEAQIFEAEQQAIDRALRHANREDPGQPATDGKWLVGVEQGVDQLTDTFLSNLAQRPHGVFGDRIPGEEWYHVRNQRRRQPFLVS